MICNHFDKGPQRWCSYDDHAGILQLDGASCCCWIHAENTRLHLTSSPLHIGTRRAGRHRALTPPG